MALCRGLAAGAAAHEVSLDLQRGDDDVKDLVRTAVTVTLPARFPMAGAVAPMVHPVVAKMLAEGLAEHRERLRSPSTSASASGSGGGAGHHAPVSGANSWLQSIPDGRRAEWAKVIAEDGSKMAAEAEGQPLSDAYLSGSAGKQTQ